MCIYNKFSVTQKLNNPNSEMQISEQHAKKSFTEGEF